MAIRDPRVFTIPPGAPFLSTLSRALLDGELIDGFPAAADPLALANATIYVPTQRAAAALAEALLAASGGQSILLPRIAPLGAFEPDDAGRSSSLWARRRRAPGAARGRRSDPPPHARHARSRLGRGSCAARFAASTPRAASLSTAHEPALVATTPSQAYALAGDLAALIDDMIIEGVDWRKLETLAPEEYDSYWRITLDFLKIAFAHWPQWLEERGLIDRARRVSLMVQSEIGALEARARRGPTIIAGSTGANRATAALIAAIARSDQGAVVLPGLDTALDERAWAMIGASGEAGKGLASHPQALLHRLIAVDWSHPQGRRHAGRAYCAAQGAQRIPQRGAPSGRTRPNAGAIGRMRCQRRPSPPRLKTFPSLSPTTRPRRRSRSLSQCAKSSRRRARPPP